MLENIFKKKNFYKFTDKEELDLVLRLMFEIAISDGSLDKAELEIIKKRAGVTGAEKKSISSIIKTIIDETEKSTSLYPTVKRINGNFTNDEKIELLKVLWSIVMADNQIDPYEENLFFKIAELIKIKRSSANQIKQQVTQGLFT